MINIGQKSKTDRTAKASAFIKLSEEIMQKIKDNNVPKGNVLETARIAGILAAKNTPQIMPLCHNIELDYANLKFTFAEHGLLIESVVQANAKTGVEMEALAAVSIAALTIYDMCKMFSKAIEITGIYLLEKRGGKSGIFMRKR